MSELDPSVRREVETLAEVARIPLAADQIDDLAGRWAMFVNGIDSLVDLIRDDDAPVTIYDAEGGEDGR